MLKKVWHFFCIFHRANSVDDETNDEDQQKQSESTPLPQPKEKNPFSFNKSTPIKQEQEQDEVVLGVLDDGDDENEKKMEDDKADDTLPLVDEG